MTMIETYKNITTRDEITRKSPIEGLSFKCSYDVESEYNGAMTVPSGTTIVADFAGDFGVYGMCEIDGVLRKVKIGLEDLHKINWGEFDARNGESE